MNPSEGSWRRSSYSDTVGNQCVEAAGVGGFVLLRDSKRVSGPRVVVSPAAWRGFLGAHMPTL